jgi:hypothetical protein
MKTRLNGGSPNNLDNSVLNISTTMPLQSKGTTSSCKQDDEINTPISPRKQPGLYMIHCQVTDYRYYGESQNVSGRLASHKSMLRRRIHSNTVLQSDWNLFDEKDFQFVVLYMGEDWKEKAVRCKVESSLILKDIERVYNCFDSFENRIADKNPFYKRRHSEKTKALMRSSKKDVPNDLLGRKVSIDGQEFPSIAEASRVLGHARKTIKMRVESSSYPNWNVVEF